MICEKKIFLILNLIFHLVHKFQNFIFLLLWFEFNFRTYVISIFYIFVLAFLLMVTLVIDVNF